MAMAHDVHRVMDERLLFGAFQGQSNFNSYQSLTASDLINLPGQYQRRSNISSSITGNNVQTPQYKSRAASDILQTKPSLREHQKNSPEAEAIDRWFENIQRYEQMLEEMAAASLDQEFKDELQHINQWFRCRSDAERTAALYTVVQNASQIQIRFLITVLQRLANGRGEPYPAGQESSSEIPSYYRSRPLDITRSVISTESEYESRKRQLYPPTAASNRRYKLSSAMSEPDDMRRNRDLLASRSLGLSHPGPLYEKAMAARAQLQAINSNTSTKNSPASTATSSIVSSSSSSLSNGGSTGGLFSSPPRLRTSCSTTDLGSKSLFSTNTSTDWPFPISKKSNEIDSWSFGSLNKKKLVHTTSAPGSTASSIIGSKKKDDHLPWAIQEEQEDYCKLSATITSSLSALEQAQARLRQDLPKSTTPWSPSQKTVQTPKTETLPNSVTQPNTRQVLFTPETISNDEQNEEKPLTGLARRRKRSSAARALKDKIAAETVDFELMKGKCTV
ncbi:uncharacterized protein B0P05DRAFT_547862 [Gilbertella persicaria]|uniref:uncharacterized protein n=1 Tax=Gilbertella persicaria TaxID=101096 RepID=UPI00222058AF|nr:uncharacterized protein B0P05DRAFT_547862 [Gilbertella persicaria]KAI8074251.1 hypothetical protein B0P05DRAFT_547862 [Gilbertella persicaria]